NIASAYALLNKSNEAIKWLQFTADDGFPCYPLFENDPNLNSLRKGERFIALMAKLKQNGSTTRTCFDAFARQEHGHLISAGTKLGRYEIRRSDAPKAREHSTSPEFR